MGLPVGTVVGSGVIDAYAGWIGSVGVKHHPDINTTAGVCKGYGRLALVAGTSTCHLAISKNPEFVQGVWGPYRDVLIPGFWMAEGGQSATGKLLKHVVETHSAYKEMLEEVERTKYCKSIYDWLNDHLEIMAQTNQLLSIPFVGRHFHFYGDFFGNRSPLADSNMAGSIIGITSDKNIDNLALNYYGVLEFIALQTRHIVDTMNKSRHSIKSLYMSGSQCQNPLLMRLIADTCNMPVVIPQYQTAAVVHGAAMLGAKAASGGTEGKSVGLWSIMEQMSKSGSVIFPSNNADEMNLLEVKYKIFLDQAESQQRYRAEVEQAIKGWGK